MKEISVNRKGRLELICPKTRKKHESEKNCTECDLCVSKSTELGVTLYVICLEERK